MYLSRRYGRKFKVFKEKVKGTFGSFLLHQITHKHGENFGLYPDDGLGVLKATPAKLKLSKKISAQFSIIMA